MKLLIVSLLLVGGNAFAATVNANAYIIDTGLRLFEVCGNVVGATSSTMVDITVDPGKYEGHYVTMTTANGNFCQIVRIQGTKIDIQSGLAKLQISSSSAVAKPN
jgi:hypothetical protein